MCRLDFMGTSYSTPKMMPLGKCFGGTCQAQCIEWFSSKLHTSNAQGISSCHHLLYNLSRLGVDYLPGVPVTPPPQKKNPQHLNPSTHPPSVKTSVWPESGSKGCLLWGEEVLNPLYHRPWSLAPNTYCQATGNYLGSRRLLPLISSWGSPQRQGCC